MGRRRPYFLVGAVLAASALWCMPRAPSYTRQISDAIAISVQEAARINLVDRCAAPPVNWSHLGLLSNHDARPHRNALYIAAKPTRRLPTTKAAEYVFIVAHRPGRGTDAELAEFVAKVGQFLQRSSFTLVSPRHIVLTAASHSGVVL
jgi:hypothetical protein